MKYKVLAFDIDGTLTNSRKEITPETRAAILRAADMGCTIVIATGRPPQGVVRYVNELELPDKEGYVLALNGGLLENCSTGTAISRTFLPMEYYHEICAIAKEYKVNLMTYQGDDVISENTDDKYIEIESRINGLGVKQVDNLEKYLTFEVPKFLMLGDGDYLAEVEKKGQYFEDKLTKIDGVKSVRRMGLMIGIELEKGDAHDIAIKCVENGLLIITAKDLLRMLPPLVIDYNEIDEAINILEKTIKENN